MGDGLQILHPVEPQDSVVASRGCGCTFKLSSFTYLVQAETASLPVSWIQEEAAHKFILPLDD